MPYLLKGCVHCGGDLCEAWDSFDGFYRSCLQCGRRPGEGRINVRAGVGFDPAAAGRRPLAMAASRQAMPP